MAVRPNSPTATALAIIYIKLTKIVSGQTVEEFFLKVLGYNKKQYNSVFISDDQKLFAHHWDPHDQDVTLLYKLLQRVCGLAKASDLIWITPGDTIEYYLFTIKTIRNFLSHSAIILSSEKLVEMFDNLQKSFTAVFEKVEKITGHSTSTELQNLIDGLSDIFTSQVTSPQTWKDCTTILAQARQERAILVFMWAKEELTHHYGMHLNIASPISWLSSHFSQGFMNIQDIFTDLEMVNSHRPVRLEQLLHLGKVVLVQGQPGIGKTAIVKYMATKWSPPAIPYIVYSNSSSEGLSINGIDNPDILLVMQCKYILSENLIQYLKEDILKKTLKDVAYEEVIPFLDLAKVTILVDGWDEASPFAKNVIREALKKLPPDTRFLITSRPEFIPDLKTDIENICGSEIEISNIRIVGFNPKSRSMFINKVFDRLLQQQSCSSSLVSKTANQPKAELFSDFLEEKEDILGDMTYIPLTLAFLVILWNDDSESVSNITSTTELFNKLFDMMMRSLAERLRVSDPRNSYILKRECRKWVIHLGKEAWASLKENKTYLSEKSKENLENLCDRRDLNIIEMFSSLLASDTAGTVENYVWSFMHKSLQEFCGALYLCQLIQDENIDILTLFLEDQSSFPHSNLLVTDSEVLLYFVIGLLTKSCDITFEQVDQIIKVAQIVSKGHRIFGRLILESHENKVLLKRLQGFNFVIKDIMSSDINLVMALLKHTNSTIDIHTSVHIKKITPQMLQLMMEYYNNTKGFRPTFRFTCLENLIKISKHIQDNIPFGCEKSVNLLLSTTQESTNIKGGVYYSTQDIILSTPGLADLINSSKQPPVIPEQIKQLREYIGGVAVKDFKAARWLLQQTHCQLHPGVGRSVSEILSLVQGLEPMVNAGDPTSDLPQHIQELWCGIVQVNKDDLLSATWLMRHTRCRLCCWSRDRPMTGACIQVYHETQELMNLVKPHFQGVSGGIPLTFEYPSLGTLLNEGISFVQKLIDLNIVKNEKLLIAMEVELSNPLGTTSYN